MTDFSKLDPETRAFAIVGQFLSAFAKMEEALHGAIGAALTIGTTEIQILCVNIGFRDKTNILRTLFDVTPTFSETEKNTFRPKLRALAEYSEIRNMVAHNPFAPDETVRGVEFFTVKARGTFSLPKEVWLDDRARHEIQTISEHQKVLDELGARFRIHPPDQSSLAQALHPQHGAQAYAESMHATQQRMTRAARRHLGHQAPDSLDSPQPNLEKTPQTPDKPREKE